MNNTPCDEIQVRLSEYLDSALSEEEKRRIAMHIAGCVECRSTFDDLRVTKAALAQEAVPPPSPNFWPKLYSDLRRLGQLEPETQTPSHFLHSLRVWLGRMVTVWTIPRSLGVAAACTVVLLLIGITWTRWVGVPDDVDDYVAQHAFHSAATPLSDQTRMTFVNSEMVAQRMSE